MRSGALEREYLLVIQWRRTRNGAVLMVGEGVEALERFRRCCGGGCGEGESCGDDYGGGDRVSAAES